MADWIVEVITTLVFSLLAPMVTMTVAAFLSTFGQAAMGVALLLQPITAGAYVLAGDQTGFVDGDLILSVDAFTLVVMGTYVYALHQTKTILWRDVLLAVVIALCAPPLAFIAYDVAVFLAQNVITTEYPITDVYAMFSLANRAVNQAAVPIAVSASFTTKASIMPFISATLTWSLTAAVFAWGVTILALISKSGVAAPLAVIYAVANRGWYGSWDAKRTQGAIILVAASLAAPILANYLGNSFIEATNAYTTLLAQYPAARDALRAVGLQLLTTPSEPGCTAGCEEYLRDVVWLCAKTGMLSFIPLYALRAMMRKND